MNISERIYYLLQRYTDNTATEAEIEELADWLNNPLHDEAAKDVLLQELEQTRPLEQHSERRLQKVLQQLKSNSDPAQPGRIVPLSTKWFGIKRTWYAVAAILLVALTTIFVFNMDKKNEKAIVVAQPTSTPQNDLLPGGEKAILTLDDGTKIVLDSAANGTLAQQGNMAIIKLANGQVHYEGKGATNRQSLTNTMQTPRGGQYHLQLSDGTNVWLNAASSITYPVVFAGNQRQVIITGEAYFEVAKNDAKPFIVQVNGAGRDMSVEVLGTHFNINAYADEATIRTTLLEGSVKVLTDRQSKIMRPGQQAVVANDISLLNPANAEEAIAWKSGFFHFDRADIKTVMRQLSRWYDVEVVYEGPVPTDTFIGDLPMDSNASTVLKALEKVQVHFKIEGRKIIVMS